MTTPKVVQIDTESAQRSLSPAQKKFNTLIKTIDLQKALLAEWQDALSFCQREAAVRLAPLRATLVGHEADLVMLLDQQCMSHKFSAGQLEKLSHVITQICEELITRHQRDDLKPVFDRYSEDDFDTVKRGDDRIALDLMKSALEQEFGVSLDDAEFDINDPEASAERMAEKFRRQQEQAEAARSQRKKSAKQRAKEEREREEAAHVSKSIQAVYRQLVGALHPDREPDPVERERKTELMKEVTVAYGNKDLLRLLELQIAVEQIDLAKLGSMADDRLKQFNKILSGQLAELREEVQLKESEIRSMLQISPLEPLSPRRLGLLIKEDIRRTQDAIVLIQRDLRLLKDVKALKAWLKGYRIPDF